jgi:hypothetical protein
MRFSSTESAATSRLFSSAIFKEMARLGRSATFVSPFTLGDEDEIGALRSDIAFLERLGSELTRPVRPSGAAIEYVPSQYLCEFIKKAGWDGVIYRSSVSDGKNLALFDPARAIPGRVQKWKVERVAPQIELLA